MTKWSPHLPTAFSSLIPTNHRLIGKSLFDRPSITSMTIVHGCDNDDVGASSSSSTSSRNSGRRLFSFVEARRIARGHGFDSREEFVEYSCPGAYQLPKDADVVWAEEWRGWDDFLGVTLSFEHGRDVARALDGICTEDSYLDYINGGTISDDDVASRLPYRPDLKYKDEWLGWDDFLIG
ncbi:hypothetical protein ACHAXA_005109 [Cyclostephanos tholiformis]|uniref:Uncharacterized protein n=1 Tax=Cyclostephanos tholiformis TaxID=382380 RepID=A0ABD3RXC4_9STRA